MIAPPSAALPSKGRVCQHERAALGDPAAARRKTTIIYPFVIEPESSP
ncbi:MAG: hypothetical protein M0R80_28195 [Proteobacteria bacterium]|nr:hypothetical protein [Pseudomonadota bacterium]